MQSYSVTITCSRMASLDPHSLLTPKGFKLYNKIYIKYILQNFEATFLGMHFSLVMTFFLELWLSVCFWSNMFLWVFTSMIEISNFQNWTNHPVKSSSFYSKSKSVEVYYEIVFNFRTLSPKNFWGYNILSHLALVQSIF